MLDQKFWEKYFKVYDVLNVVIPYQEVLADIEKELDLSPEDVVLDVGSGTGNFMMRIKGKCKEAVGIDFSPQGIKIHKMKDPGAIAQACDITKGLPFKDNSFSKIASNNVIYTLNEANQKKVLTEIYRVLKPGGKFAVSNVKNGFSPVKIYTDHIVKSVKTMGFLKTVNLFLKLLWPTLKMFYYNAKIKKSGGVKQYNFLKAGEQAVMLKNTGFKGVSPDKFTYSSQAIMNSCYK